MALVLFNTGWMKYYRGRTKSDQIMNGGQYVVEEKDGGELWNFDPIGEYFYGYVKPGKMRINVERLGADPGASYADDVTVVFTATRPQGGRVVVGWYRGARVYRDVQKVRGRDYFAMAGRKNCTLWKVDERVHWVPTASRPEGSKFVMGQSNIRYVDENDEKEEFVKLLRRYIEDPSISIPDLAQPIEEGSGGEPRQSDPEQRAKVEKAAIEYVIEHYKDQGFTHLSVEPENKGWDLEVSRGSVRLLVEVKGRSGDDAKVELTPNEYEKMRLHKLTYRLAIVTNALGKKPRLSIVSFNGSDNTWRDQDNREADIEPLKGARINLR